MSHKQIVYSNKCNSNKTVTIVPVWGVNEIQHKGTKHKELEGEGATNKLCLDTSSTQIKLIQFSQSGERTTLSIKDTQHF